LRYRSLGDGLAALLDASIDFADTAALELADAISVWPVYHYFLAGVRAKNTVLMLVHTYSEAKQLSRWAQFIHRRVSPPFPSLRQA